jgi:predicted flap endonuclease-1-like 5' DNA nuclease
MWDVWFKRWLDLAFWWLPKKQDSPSRPTEDAPPLRTPERAPAGADTASKPAATPPAPAAGEVAPEPPGPSGHHVAAATRAEPAKAVTPPVPDDLTVIKGIGPAVQNKLRELGITTFADLAAADPDRLMEQLKGSQPLTATRVRGWTEDARDRARV